MPVSGDILGCCTWEDSATRNWEAAKTPYRAHGSPTPGTVGSQDCRVGNSAPKVPKSSATKASTAKDFTFSFKTVELIVYPFEMWWKRLLTQ